MLMAAGIVIAVETSGSGLRILYLTARLLPQ